MNQDPLKEFLTRHHAETPPGSDLEVKRIWKKINEHKKHSFFSWFWVATSTAAAGLALGLYLNFQKTPQTISMAALTEEQYLQQEWQDLIQDVDAEVESEFVSFFDK